MVTDQYLNLEYKHEYDSYGKEIRYTSYYYNDTELTNKHFDKTRSAEYEYDINGNLIKETWYYRDSTVWYRTEYEYIYE